MAPFNIGQYLDRVEAVILDPFAEVSKFNRRGIPMTLVVADAGGDLIAWWWARQSAELTKPGTRFHISGHVKDIRLYQGRGVAVLFGTPELAEA